MPALSTPLQPNSGAAPKQGTVPYCELRAFHSTLPSAQQTKPHPSHQTPPPRHPMSPPPMASRPQPALLRTERRDPYFCLCPHRCSPIQIKTPRKQPIIRMSSPPASPDSSNPLSTLAISLKKSWHSYPSQLFTIEIGHRRTYSIHPQNSKTTPNSNRLNILPITTLESIFYSLWKS